MRNRRHVFVAAGLAVAVVVILWRLIALGGALVDYWAIRSGHTRWTESHRVLADPAAAEAEEPGENSEAPGDRRNRRGARGGGDHAELKRAGLFGPPAPDSPVILTAILGDVAIINGQETRVGDNVPDGSKIMEIQPNRVVIEKDGNRRDLVLFNALPGG